MSKTEELPRYVCIHGHLYQPPRENPWLEAIELQDSAYPYHDWNERINAECYAQNAASRIRDPEGRIARIVNNYARISFNFGPTVLSWMCEHAPDTYRSIIAADRDSLELFGGHGSAMAQAYNHMIMPLASARDKVTQVRWGVRDFQHRFGRAPRGMWLPETAVDLETLGVMADAGIEYTILSPYQAKAVRPIDTEKWRDVSGGRVDPSTAYLQRLPGGRSIVIFYYDGPISQAVAFERLLDSGEGFAQRLLDGFSDDRAWPQLVHIATDGESYGHHHRHGDMALAFALEHIETNLDVQLINYAAFLAAHPPQHETQILEDSAWSCSHGVGRWRAHCGCASGGHPDWNQQWRGPLRDALDWLRDELEPRFEKVAGELLRDPWAARDDYIEVILDRSADSVEAFLARNVKRELSRRERIKVFKLLEMQRHAMLMYTSCGWFFDELSGIETVQVIQYAARVIQLARDACAGADLEPGFLTRLERARSNLPEHRDGREIFVKWVKPTMLNMNKVGAHFAVSSLFEDYADDVSIYCYDIRRSGHHMLSSGRMKLAYGQAQVTSRITHETTSVSYAALHFGDTHVLAGVRQGMDPEETERIGEELSDAFARADAGEELRLFHKHFGEETFSLRSLFRDEQRQVVAELLDTTLDRADQVYLQLYEDNAHLMRFLADLGMPMPGPLQKAAEHTLNHRLRLALEHEPFDREQITQLLEQAGSRNITLDHTTLEFTARTRLEALAGRLTETPGDIELLTELERATDILALLPFEVDLWRIRNVYYELLINLMDEYRARTDPTAAQWVEHFTNLGRKLSIAV
jgi:alpha-amylase/alpha-mannosidase (GH57 family)